MAIEQRLVVLHLHTDSQTILHVVVEIYQMGVDVVQESVLGLQPEDNSEATAKRFHVPSLCIRVPNRLEMRHEPALSTRPL